MKFPPYTPSETPKKKTKVRPKTGFVTFAWKNHFLQHVENCTNASVFARCFATRNKNIINIVGLGFRGKKISVFTVLFAPRI
jgi:hypothetical protein